MKRRNFRGAYALGIAGLVGLGVLGAERTAQAEEIQLTGPLAGAPPVRKLRQHRKGRFEIAPAFSFTLLDEYRRTMVVGATATYNAFDWLGFGVYGGYGVVAPLTALSENVNTSAPRNPRTAVNVAKGDFGAQVSKMTWMVVPQVQIAPFRGKLAILSKVFVDTDLYLHLGLGFHGLEERADCAGGACTTDVKAMASRVAISPNFGLGFKFYTSKLVNFGLEYRAFPYSWNRAGLDQRGGGNDGKFPDQKIDSNDQTFKFNQMITLSVGFAFPSQPSLSE
ncbi:MAG TPA: outer membrane beta-barrel domain-containing protein [Polyangiaceae bacterium]|jgi:outer membrane beta-barrel protein|nr:outer membrane beta-barrel domain-containing protein [Polyangiaceae bacterium]